MYAYSQIRKLLCSCITDRRWGPLFPSCHYQNGSPPDLAGWFVHYPRGFQNYSLGVLHKETCQCFSFLTNVWTAWWVLHILLLTFAPIMYINTAGPNADKVSCDDGECKGVDLTENGLFSCLQCLVGFRPDCPSKTICTKALAWNIEDWLNKPKW